MGIVFLCIFWFLSAGAQDWQIRHFTVDDGLPHNIGFDILQDDKGFIWLGTDNGLARFDGKNFVSLGVGDGLKGSSIISLSKGKSGEIYCSAYKKGVSRIDYPHITQTQFGVAADFKAILFHPKLYFFKEEVFTIENRQELNQATLVHHQNNVLTNIHLKFEDGQLSMEKLFSQELWNELRYQKAHNFTAQNPLNPVRVYASAEGALFFTTNQGLFQYHGAGDFTLLANGKFDAIDGTQDGTIYAAGPGKLFSWDGKHLDTLLEDKRIDCEQFKVTEEGLVCWFNKDRISLWIHQLKTQKTDQLNKLLASKSPFSFLQKDSNGNFWISTNGDGLFSISKSMIRDFSSALSLQQKFVNVISESPEGDILLGTRGGLVSLTLTPNGENTSYPFTHNHILSQTEIFRIFNTSSETSDQTHRALFSSMEGTWELEWASQNLTKRNIPISNNLGFDPSGRIYRSGTDGIWVNPVNNKDSLFAFVSRPGFLPPRGFGSLKAAHTKDIWFGAHTCLYHFNGDKQEAYFVSDGLPDSLILDLAFSRDSVLWVATPKGLAYFDQDTFIAHPQNALLQRACHHMVFDKQNQLWVAGPRGIFKVENDGLLRLNRQLGLPSNDVNQLFFDRQDRLWVAMSEGICMVEDMTTLQPQSPPELYIEEIRLNDTLREFFPAEIPIQTKIYIQIAVIEFETPDVVEVQYRLTSGDPWIPTNSQDFTFSNLLPESYQLQFRARTLNSDWAVSESLAFEIMPPWWRRWWAIAGLIFVLLLAAGGLIRIRIKNIAKRAAAQNELNQQMAHLQLSALQSQLNPHFMFNALNAIQYFILDHDEVAANDFLAKFSRLMRLFLEASHARYISLAEELELLELYIELEQLRFDGKFDYQIKLAPNLNTNDLEIPSMMLQPYVENAINHGLRHKEGHGMLALSFSMEAKILTIIIEDDGIGRARSEEIKESQNQKRISRGMQLLTDRLKLLSEMMGADIHVQVVDKQGENGTATGTRVEIKLPV